MPRIIKTKKYRKKLPLNRYRMKRVLGMKPTLFKLKQVVVITSNGTGTISGAIGNSPTGAQDWTNLLTLYDAYKVSALKIQYVPSFPNDASTLTTYRPFYFNYDPDTAAGPASVNEIIQYDNVKIKNLFRPFNIYYKLPNYTQSGLATAKMYGKGYLDVLTPTSMGSIQYIAEGVTASHTYGTFVLTYYVAFTVRR